MAERQGFEPWVGLPLLCLCEDNGIGISTKSPAGWIAAVLQSRPGLSYFETNGLDIVETYRTAKVAPDHVRRTRKPAVIHMRCVCLYGHTCPDVEAAYRPIQEIGAAERQDPLIHTAARLIHEGIADAGGILVHNPEHSAGQSGVSCHLIRSIRPPLSCRLDG